MSAVIGIGLAVWVVFAPLSSIAAEEQRAVGSGDAYGYPESYPGKDMKAMHVKKGDRVYFVRNRAMEVKLGEKKEKFHVLKERDILGILEKGE